MTDGQNSANVADETPLSDIGAASEPVRVRDSSESGAPVDGGNVPEPVRSEPPAAGGDKLMDAALEAEVEAAMSAMGAEDLDTLGGPQAGAGGAHEDGGLVSATVVSIQGDDVFIDVGGRAEGVVAAAQFETVPAVGSKIEVVPERYDAASGLMVYSREGAVMRATWDALKPGVVVEGRCIGMVKGGLELDVNGIRAFMPASQCDVARMKDISVLIGEMLQCEVMKVDARGKDLVVSRRKLQEKIRKAQRDQVLSELEVGQVRSGKVVNVTDYGAFVDLGGIEGLLHISDMSYGRVRRASDVVEPGQTVEVKVLKHDTEKKKISLGLKQIQPDPWDGVPAKYAEGMQITGRVVRLADFGAFVELEEGVDALVPLAEFIWTKRIRHPSDIVQVDQNVTASVVRVEPEKRRISLSLKRIEEDPWALVEEQYPRNEVVTGKVMRTTDFGAFVELHPGVDGLVHISELSEEHVRNVTDVVQVGQEVECRVVSSDHEARKISLSLKNVHGAAEMPTEEEMAAKPQKKRKKPLRGGLESGGGWFIG